MPFDAKEARRRRSSSLVYTEPPESIEQLNDQSALPNLNAEWVNAKGAWVIHLVLIVIGKILFDIMPGVSQETSWTLTNISYMAGSYLMFHYVRGVPFDFNSGAYDNLNMWEQIDNGDQYTPAKKFLMFVPIALFLVSTHYTHYDLTYFVINMLATIAVVIPKLPSNPLNLYQTIDNIQQHSQTAHCNIIHPPTMTWSQLEPTPPHVSYLVLASFLILYALFSLLIRNRLHLSEPPIATVFGIIVGPRGLSQLTPYDWGFGDDVIQEFTRLIVGIQCFAVGLELPEHYFKTKWRDVATLLGPVMAFGWLVCAGFIMTIFKTDFATALIISACLTPTDPVLAASVLSNSQFSNRVPKRIRDLLSAESGCNDGVSFPFLYIGLSILTRSTVGGIFKKWFLITILYQCALGIALGLVIGHVFNRIYKFSHKHEMMGGASYLAFYLLLAIFSLGVASTLGVDDFLVVFFAGLGFASGGNSPTAETRLPVVIDLMLNSTMFVFFGAMIPWKSFNHYDEITPWRLIGLLILILLFRRMPIVYTTYRLKMLPHVKSTTEALFCGHFGPMGVGALFLAMEARAQLETDTSLPLPEPPAGLPIQKQRAIELIWPIICFVVLGSTLVHGLSTLAISLGGHFSRHKGERAPLMGAEREGFYGMVRDTEDADGGGLESNDEGEEGGPTGYLNGMA
ncbi:ORMDL-domain-containing protein [Lentithecium fluviatile CBS 122367]|uniref:ORMDL-domain-containing protein n=1 Tax=Lentithecium fluviatile CBS 122367 TaxID=1168545 RepID=A0A6G1JIH9_9PLEO|nr:ORMDL-domain-containing protein [Lentithecium fluviatile CBS 122367]